MEFFAGDAREIVPSLTGAIDFVLIDLWQDLCISCFNLVYPKLSEGAFVAADNILHPEPIRELTPATFAFVSKRESRTGGRTGLSRLLDAGFFHFGIKPII